MRSRDGIKVAGSTLGAGSPYEHLSGGYRWQGVPDWEPGDVRFRKETAPAISGVANSARRQKRIDQFGTILAGLSGGDPEDASPAHVRQAGEIVGVGVKTAREYRHELVKQQRGEG